MKPTREILDGLDRARRDGRLTDGPMPPAPPPDESEAAFQSRVIALAVSLGWLVHAERAGRTAKGWRTPISGAAGFPDLVLVRGRVVWVELKSEKGRVSPDQETWITMLAAAGQEVYIWRPSSWPNIQRTLR